MKGSVAAIVTNLEFGSELAQRLRRVRYAGSLIVLHEGSGPQRIEADRCIRDGATNSCTSVDSVITSIQRAWPREPPLRLTKYHDTLVAEQKKLLAALTAGTVAPIVSASPTTMLKPDTCVLDKDKLTFLVCGGSFNPVHIMCALWWR